MVFQIVKIMIGLYAGVVVQLNTKISNNLDLIKKINHFPNSVSLCKKNNLAKYLNRMQKAFPSDYDFYPKTWNLPY